MYIKIKEPYEQTIHIMKVHHETEDCYVCELKKDNSYLSASKEWVLAKSENLEELCDEFVDDTYKDFYNIKKENGKTFVWSMKQRFKYWNSIDFNFVGTIYGAIYTDKGLIYVAKMNHEGDLELI